VKLLDPSHPFFRPLWRRVALVVVSFLWAAVEARLGNVGWSLLFAAIGAYLAWMLLVTFPREDDSGE